MNEKYVPKEEVKPLRKQFHDWMQSIHDEIKHNGVGFTYMLVGSAKRNLVIRHHNKGFDCDYQIKITHNEKRLKPRELKHLFRNALNKIVKKSGYNDCEDSTSSLTIKKKGEKSDIEHSYDIVILARGKEGLEILRYHKSLNGDGNYVFELLPDMRNARENFQRIRGKKMWNKLRTIYYKKKMDEMYGCKAGKKSFQLLNEAVNEVLMLDEKVN